MKFTCLKKYIQHSETEIEYPSYGTIDLHQNPNITSEMKEFPKQFTVEFWIKCKFNPDITAAVYPNKKITKFNLFDIYLFNEDATNMYPKTGSGYYTSVQIPDGTESTVEKNEFTFDKIDESTGEIKEKNAIGTKNAYQSLSLSKSEIGMAYVVDRVSNKTYYEFNIGTYVRQLDKFELDNKWNHIAFVWDYLGGTSGIWYVNGNLFMGLNIDDDRVMEWRDRKFARFLWTLHQGTPKNNNIELYDHYVWLYNLSITEYVAGTSKNTYDGTRFKSNFVPKSFPFKNNINFGYALSVDNDESAPPVIDAESKHKVILENDESRTLVYLPFTDEPTECFGLLGINFNKFDHIQNDPQCIESTTMSDYLWDYDYAYNLGSNTTFITENIAAPVSIIADAGIDFDFDKEDGNFKDGFTIDFFTEVSSQKIVPGTMFIAHMPNNNIAANSTIKANENDVYSDKLDISYIYPKGLTTLANLTASANHTIKPDAEYISTPINTTINAANALADTVQSIFSLSSYNQIVASNDRKDKSIANRSATLLPAVAAKNSPVKILPLFHGTIHYAVVFKNNGAMKQFINGNMIEYGINNFKMKSTGNSNAFYKFILSNTAAYNKITHFRISKGCLWYDRSFDPTTDPNLFKTDTDANRNSIDLYDKTYSDNWNSIKVALYYPINNPTVANHPYARAYSSDIFPQSMDDIYKDGLDDVEIGIRSNFHVEPYSTNYENIKIEEWDSNIFKNATTKPSIIYNKHYPAVTSNSYKNYKNIIKFRNYHIEDQSWIFIVWVFLKKQIESSSTTKFNLLYVSGFGFDGRDCEENSGTKVVNDYRNIGNGFIGIDTNVKGSLYVSGNTPLHKKVQYPWSTSDYTMVNYGYTTSHQGKFNLDDWNQIIIESDIEHKYVKMYLNGQEIHNEQTRRFSYLHRLFLYTGASDAPLRPYFAGVKVVVGNEVVGLTNNKNQIPNWIDR